MSNCHLFNEYIRIYGVNSQLIVCVEELAELIQAIQKYMRIGIDKEINTSIMNDLYEEIADVDIMIGQMKNIFSKKHIQIYKKEKLQKMKDKINV